MGGRRWPVGSIAVTAHIVTGALPSLWPHKEKNMRKHTSKKQKSNFCGKFKDLKLKCVFFFFGHPVYDAFPIMMFPFISLVMEIQQVCLKF